MLQKLTEDSTKTPNPDRSEIIDLTLKAWGKVTMDYEGAFKQNFVTNAFNGCEDILVLDRIFRQVGDMIKFRKELLSKAPPKSLKDVVKNLIPPKSIARSVEGSELLDYMTDASKIENVVVGDVEFTTTDKEEEELEETE